jgi:hypothetical protein
MQACPSGPYFLVGGDRDVYRYGQAGTRFPHGQSPFFLSSNNNFLNWACGNSTPRFLAYLKPGQMTRFWPIRYSLQAVPLTGSCLLPFPLCPISGPRMYMWEYESNSTIWWERHIGDGRAKIWKEWGPWWSWKSKFLIASQLWREIKNPSILFKLLFLGLG